MSTSYDNQGGRPPGDFLRVIRERFWIVLLTVVLAVGLALVFSLRQTPLYQAEARVLRQTAALDQTLFGTSIFRIADADRELQTGVNLVKLPQVGLMVKDYLQTERQVWELLAMVDVRGLTKTDIIGITAHSPDPAEAADVANAFAIQFIRYRQEANKSILAAADEKIIAELEQLTPEELASERGATLSRNHEELTILQSMQTGGFELVQTAQAPSTATSPKPVRNAGFAFVGGLFLGIMLIFLIDYLDRRMKDEEALEREFGIPVLASVPRISRRWGSGDGHRSRAAIGFSGPQSAYLEAFRTLRSNLRFYQLDSKTQTLLFTSALPREGKTVTVINLGLTLALSGARVILLEADLRRPMLHHYLGLENMAGVSTILTGTTTFDEVVQIVRISDFTREYGFRGNSASQTVELQKNLLCIASGPMPPNPAELVGSPMMRELIGMATAHAEYVLIDAPPLLLVSDALNLAAHVDGVVIATRLHGTTIEQARDTRAMLERTGVRILGLVANGISRKQRGYYRSRHGTYYTRS